MHLPNHGRYGFSTIDRRADYDWPAGKRLAVYFVIAVEHFAFGAGAGEDISTIGAPQTQRNFGWRDYGQRVGLWRLLAMSDSLRLPVALALNGAAYYCRSELVDRLRDRGDEILGHGRTSSELQHAMWADDEALVIRSTTAAIEARHGAPPAGWWTPAFDESRLTPDLLKEAGYRYLLDWPADDQPLLLTTRAGPILSLPFSLELNDVTALLHRKHGAREYADMIVDQIETMADQSCRHPLVCGIGLHPYVVGQPSRLRPLRRALAHCKQHRPERLWFTRPGMIAEHCLALPQGTISA